jgi:hypothetical protein
MLPPAWVDAQRRQRRVAGLLGRDVAEQSGTKMASIAEQSASPAGGPSPARRK